MHCRVILVALWKKLSSELMCNFIKFVDSETKNGQEDTSTLQMHNYLELDVRTFKPSKHHHYHLGVISSPISVKKNTLGHSELTTVLMKWKAIVQLPAHVQ